MMSHGSEDDRASAETAAIFDAVLNPARAERTVSPVQIEAEGGLTVDETAIWASRRWILPRRESVISRTGVAE
jgi:hypothetical protein